MATHQAAHPPLPEDPDSKAVPPGWVSATIGVQPVPSLSGKPKRWRGRLWRWQTLAGAVTFLLGVQIVGLLVARHSGGDATPKVSRTLSLGRFEFSRPAARDKAPLHGSLDVSLQLVDDLTSAERRKITDAAAALQQTADECLRRARVADFADARLFRLRNQVQDRLNEALGFEAVAEVNVANFHLDDPANK
jgi:hypothetical protein